jgi:soluble lytic murein transglycosylase-like protein
MKFIIIILLLTSQIQCREISWQRFVSESPKYSKLIGKYARIYNLDTLLIQALISWESNWTVNAQGDYNCNGLMQVKDGSFDPEINIRQGCSKLRKAMDVYKGHFTLTLVAYNRGIAGAKTYLKKHRSACSFYAKNILKIYRRLHARQMSKMRIK